MSQKKIRWGIIGLGKIAHKFAADLQKTISGELHAVASRSTDKAITFKEQYAAKKYYSTYEDLVCDPDVDVVYVATPHSFHFEHSMLCLKAGKSVLCEKPMGMNTEQVIALHDEAKKQGVFLMEGLWTRFIPATKKLLSLINAGEIGDPILITADFGFRLGFDPSHRLFNKLLGGGSLLDIGIYPIYLCLLCLGVPTELQANARFTETKVDSTCSMLFNYENNAKAILYATIESTTPIEAFIHGTLGSIKLHSPFHHTQKLTLEKNGTQTDFIIPYEGNGYVHEIEEVHLCLKSELQESTLLSLKTSVELIQIMDAVKKQIGLTYIADELM